MSVFNSLGEIEPTTEQAAMEVRRALAHVFRQMEISLSSVRGIVEKHGRANIEEALGDDAAQVRSLYETIKQLVESNKPETSVPDLPSE